MPDAIVTYEGRRVTFCDAQPRDYIERMLLEGTWYERENLEFIRSLQVVGNYVDAGAFIGTHSLYFSLFCPSVRVFSFEANPRTYQKLIRNLLVNGATKCQAFNVGLAETAGRAILKEANETNRGATNLVVGDGYNAIDVVPLDSFNLTDVKLMKIDVEGLELLVLKGAVNTLKTVEHLFVEMWSEPQSRDRAMEYTQPKVITLLAHQGIKVQRELATDRLWYFKRD